MSKIERIQHCSHWGAYTVLVQDGRVVGVEPFAQDPHPSDQIESIKGWADTRRRVLRPMARKSWLAARREGRPMTPDEHAARGQEAFEPIEWDEALTLVAGEIQRVIRDHGNRSIFSGSYGWTSCGRFHHAQSLVRRTMNCVGGFTGHRDTYSIAAGPVILRHVLGSTDACQSKANTFENLVKHTDTLVVFGGIALRTAQSEAGGIARHRLPDYLKAMSDRGMRIVLVSPQQDDLPDFVRAEWWPIRPNTDTALMLALAREVVAAGKHDADFLARHCSGSEVFLDYLAGLADGVEKTAGWAASITGIDPARIRELASTLASTRSMLSVSWSLQRAVHGEQPFWAALALASVTGQIGLPGGGVAYGYGSLGGVGGPQVRSRAPGMFQLANDLDSFIPVARITDALENPGKAYDYEGLTRHYPDIRLIYWAGGNPYHHHQDLHRMARAWTRPDTIVIQDPMWTASALRADVVLPASTSLERNDIAGNSRSDMIIAMKRVIAPMGEARSDYEIFTALAEKLGVRERFTEGRTEMEWIRHLYDLSRNDAKKRFGFEMPEFDQFWAQGYTDVPADHDHTYLADYRADPQAHRLATESGRIVLGSEMLAKKGYADCLPHPAWLAPNEWLDAATEGSGVFHMLTPQPEGRLHSQLVHAGPSGARMPDGRERLKIHTDDAARLGIASNDVVRVHNERGACLAVAVVTDGVRKGVVALPTGAWWTPSVEDPSLDLAGNPNVLTQDVPTSSMGQGCAAQTCVVSVEKWTGTVVDAGLSYDRLIERMTQAEPLAAARDRSPAGGRGRVSATRLGMLGCAAFGERMMRWRASFVGVVLWGLLAGVPTAAGAAEPDVAMVRVPAQFIAALGAPGARSGDNAAEWGLWTVDPGNRGVDLDRYPILVREGGLASAGWRFDGEDWWLEEHGLIMEQPVFPVPPRRYRVTGDRGTEAILAISAPDASGRMHWRLSDGATLHDVTHLACRAARYRPAAGARSCTPARADPTQFPVDPGAEMPPVAGCAKQDYAVLIVIGVEAAGR